MAKLILNRSDRQAMKLDMARPATRKKREDAAEGKPLEDLEEGGERHSVWTG